MPNYPTHAKWGRVGAIIVGIVICGGIYLAFDRVLLAIAVAIGVGTTTFVGALYPDIDHQNSIPRRKAAHGFRVLIVFAIAALVIVQFEQFVNIAKKLITIEEMTTAQNMNKTIPFFEEMLIGVGTTLTAVILVRMVDPAISLVTRKHRGWTHSVHINIILIGAIGGSIWALTDKLAISERISAVAVVCGFFVGTLIHLGLDDEIL